MRPSEWLVAVGGDRGNVSLVAKGDSVKIKLLGASVPASVPCGTGDLNSLTVAPEADKGGIVAVVLRKQSGYGKNSELTKVSFFLHVKNNDGKTEINLEDEWFPAGNRLGQAVYDNIEVVINGKWYTTDEYYDPNFKYENIRKTGKLFIPNGGTLLCQYLAGDIDAQLISDAVRNEVHEADVPAEVTELKGKVNEIEVRLKKAYDRIVELGNIRARLNVIIGDLIDSHKWQLGRADKLRKIRTRVAEEMSK